MCRLKNLAPGDVGEGGGGELDLDFDVDVDVVGGEGGIAGSERLESFE